MNINTFNHNTGLVGGSVVSNHYIEQAGTSQVWLRKPNKNGKDTFIEIVLMVFYTLKLMIGY